MESNEFTVAENNIINKHMINISRSSPSKYLEECLNANLLRGISTTLIESGILNKLTWYWPGNHWNDRENNINEFSLNACKEDFDRHFKIQTLKNDIIDLDSGSFSSQADRVQKQKKSKALKIITF